MQGTLCYFGAKHFDDENILTDFIELLELLQKQNKIADLEITTQASVLIAGKTASSTISFKVVGGFTIGKYHKIKDWIQKTYPVLSVKRLYHKQKIMVYYNECED